MKFPINDFTAQLFETTCWPKRNWDTKEVITDENGNATYTVKAVVPSGKRTEIVDVLVKAQSNPVEGIDALAPIKITGAHVSMGTYYDKKDKKDKKYANLYAEAVKKA